MLIETSEEGLQKCFRDVKMVKPTPETDGVLCRELLAYILWANYILSPSNGVKKNLDKTTVWARRDIRYRIKDILLASRSTYTGKISSSLVRKVLLLIFINKKEVRKVGMRKKKKKNFQTNSRIQLSFSPLRLSVRSVPRHKRELLAGNANTKPECDAD